MVTVSRGRRGGRWAVGQWPGRARRSAPGRPTGGRPGRGGRGVPRRCRDRGGTGAVNEQGGAEPGAVLGGAAALEPDPADAVLGDGQEPAQVGGAVFAVQRAFGLAFGAFGVDDLGQVPSGPGQVGGVDPPGSSNSTCSPRVADWVGEGSRSTASSTTPACSGLTAPSRSADKVTHRSPASCRALSTTRRPARGVRRPGGCTSRRSTPSPGTAWEVAGVDLGQHHRLQGGSRARRTWTSSMVPTRSESARAAHITSSSSPIRAPASATTPAGVGSGSEVIAMTKPNHPAPTPRPPKWGFSTAQKSRSDNASPTGTRAPS